MKTASMLPLHGLTVRFLMFVVLLLPVGAGVSAAELISAHGDWKAYRHGSGDLRMCFAVTGASEQSPPGGDRPKPHIYVTSWPRAGIKAEISVLVGVFMRRGTEIKIEVGGNTFTLQSDGDRGFVVDAGEEQRLLEAMRRGKALTVATTSSAGDSTRDTFSLSGVTAAVQAAASGCQ